MKIVFFGCNNTSLLIMNELLKMEMDVAGIFTIPQTFNVSYAKKPVKVTTHQSLHELGKEHGIPVISVDGKMKQFIPKLKEMKPDLCIVGGWYFMIPKDMLPVPTKGFIGFHPSLLPKYRGGAPVNWSIINGEKKTGTSLFYFDDGVDSGDIIAQREVTVEIEDTIKEVYDKINTVTVEMIREYIPLLKKGTAPRIKQDHSQATHVLQRSPEDGEIDWTWSASRIYNWIRAQTIPYPGAFTYHKNELLKIWYSKVEDLDLPTNVNYPPGTVIDASYQSRGILVSTGERAKALLVTKLGTEQLEAIDYARNKGLGKGEILGDGHVCK